MGDGGCRWPWWKVLEYGGGRSLGRVRSKEVRTVRDDRKGERVTRVRNP